MVIRRNLQQERRNSSSTSPYRAWWSHGIAFGEGVALRVALSHIQRIALAHAHIERSHVISW